MQAILKNYRQSPRKVRLVATAMKGKSVSDAEAELEFLLKRASLPIKKLLMSAVANARNNFNLAKEDLIVKSITVNKGVVLKRSMPRARGSASRINKRTSHVTLTLMTAESKPAKKSKK